MTATRHPRVAVAILSWNRRRTVLDTIGRVRSLTGVAFDIIVVDNGSDDDSPAAIRQAHPDVSVIELGTNRGFTGGVNRALDEAARSNATHAWLLNDDTVFAPDTLMCLMDDAARHPECGLFSPCIRDLGGAAAVQFVNGFIDWRRGVMRHNVPMDESPDDRWAPTPLVPGTALLCDLRVYRAIGDFDERLFAYWEDTDYAMRAARAGFGSRVVDGVWIEHADPGDRLLRQPYYAYYMIRNEATFWRTQLAAGRKVRWFRRWLADSLEWVAAARDTGRNEYAAAGIDAIWHALVRKHGERRQHVAAPRWFAYLLRCAPYALAAIARGRLDAIWRRIILAW